MSQPIDAVEFRRLVEVLTVIQTLQAECSPLATNADERKAEKNLSDFFLSHAPAFLALVEDGWQDISTAPNVPGRAVLVWTDHLEIGALQINGRWMAPNLRDIEPTHWRPLLPPPKDIQDER